MQRIEDDQREQIDLIAKQYGEVLELKRSPLVLLEILRRYGRRFAEDRGQRLIEDIASRYGEVIDLEDQPEVLIAILVRFGGIFSNGDDGGGGVSTIAVGIDAGTGGGGGVNSSVETQLDDVLRTLVQMRRDLREIQRGVDRLG